MPVYNEFNIGAMANFYSTINRGKGKYLMFCSGDDYWLPGKVEKQISFMERNLDFNVCYGKTKVSCVNNANDYISGCFFSDKVVFLKENPVPALTLCIRKSFFDLYLHEIQPQLKNWLMEDYPFVIYSAFSGGLYFTDQLLSVYRELENSVSHPTSVKKMYIFKHSIWEIQAYFAERYNIDISKWDQSNELYNCYKVLMKMCNDKKNIKQEYKSFCKENDIRNVIVAKFANRIIYFIISVFKYILPFILYKVVKAFKKKILSILYLDKRRCYEKKS